MFKATLTPIFLCAALLFSGCSSTNSGNTGRNIGVAGRCDFGALSSVLSSVMAVASMWLQVRQRVLHWEVWGG